MAFCLIFVLVGAVACGSTADPTAAPEPTAAPPAQPTASAEAMGIAPTVAPQQAVQGASQEASQQASPDTSQSGSQATAQTTAQTTAQSAASPPTAIPNPTAAPDTGAPAKDSIVVAIPTEPDALSPWSTGSAETSSIVSYNWGEPLVWLNTTSLQLGPTTSTTGWEQVAPDRWRFSLRPGVKFVNGEPWNAETAAWNINHNGDPQTGLGFGVHGPLTGTVVDDMTLDITCGHANYKEGATQSCPILPADITGVAFQAPAWWQSTEEDVRDRNTVGFGAYKFVDYVPGQYVDSAAYEDYVPSGRDDLPSPSIPNVRYVWRLETPVRSAMVQTGEADHTYLLNVEDIPNVPQAISMPQWEVEGFYIDTLWHPMLKQTKFRQALVHAINCQEIVEEIFDSATTCTPLPGVIGMPGITEHNGSYWEYDPDKSRQLLQEVGYDEEEIRIIGREGRVPKQPEVYEAMAGYWEAVGIKGKVEVTERSLWRSIRNCGVGNAVSEAGEITAENLSSPPTNCEGSSGSGHLIEFTPEWPSLDFGRPAGRLLNCFYFQSRVCEAGMQDLLERARAATLEEGRADLLEQLADRMKEDVLFIGVFQAFEVHGLVEGLQFEPRPDQRLRVAEMSWR